MPEALPPTEAAALTSWPRRLARTCRSADLFAWKTRRPASGQRPLSGPSAFSRRPNSFAIDAIEEFAHDPELEEASIRFANGDDDGAEAGLLEVLQSPDGARIGHRSKPGVTALFDLYRASGKQDRFETAAIDFAEPLRGVPRRQWVCRFLNCGWVA